MIIYMLGVILNFLGLSYFSIKSFEDGITFRRATLLALVSIIFPVFWLIVIGGYVVSNYGGRN